MTASRVTQQAVEVLYRSTAVPKARVSQQGVEVLYKSTAIPQARVSQQAVEVLYIRPLLPVLTGTVAGVTNKDTSVINANTTSNSSSIAGTSNKNIAEVAVQGIASGSIAVSSVQDNLSITAENTISANIAAIASKDTYTAEAISGENNYVEVATGTIQLIGQSLKTAVANLLGVDAYSITIQGTRDLYYLSDSMSGYAVDYYPYHVSDISEDLVGLTLNVNNSRAEHSTGLLLSGEIDGSYLADFYNRIHLSTDRLSLGNVLSDQLLYVDIWNAFFVTKDITSIDATNLTDIALGTPFAVPSTFAALQNSTMSVNVTTLGVPTIDGNFRFNFGSDYAILYLDGQRVILWPFCPLANFPETRIWDTDVLDSRAGETRYALRDTPRMSLKYTYILRSREEHSQAVAMADALAQYPLGIPLWTDNVKLQSVAQGVSTIFFDTTHVEFMAGEPAVIYSNFNRYETVQIAAVYSDRVTLTRPTKLSHHICYIAPVHVGYPTNGIDFAYNLAHSKKVTIDVMIPITYNSPSWPGGLTYLGNPVLPVKSVLTGGLSSRFSRKQETVDSETGNITVIDEETYNRQYGNISLFATNRAERYALRRQFDYLKGKYSLFWLPSFYTDIIPLGDIPNGSDSLHIQGEIFPLYHPKHVRLTGISGTTEVQFMLQILSVTDNLDGTAYMKFTSIVPSELHSISRIEILKLVRLDTDSVEYSHHNRDITTVKAVVVEVPS